MTPLSNEILKNYQTRKTKQQKQSFIRLLAQHFPELTVQEGGFPKCRNIVIGDIENARLVLTAHYNTCSRRFLPYFIAPKNPLLSILYNILLIIPIIIVLDLLLRFFPVDDWIPFWTSLVAFFLLNIYLASSHNANDNTSGVIVLCELLETLNITQRSKVVFIFTDGKLSPSRSYSKAHDTLLINFDCVSDGDHILVSANKAARAGFAAALKASFLPTEEKSILFTNAEKTFYPSDQVGFRQAVAVASLKHKKCIGYYMDRIHTSKDTVFDKSNIKLICESTLNLLKQL